MQKTNPISNKEIKRAWHLVDAKGKILGRLASQIALLLMGKNKPYFVRHLDCGDHVVVINASQIIVSGKKEKNKMYSRHSGYPGGYKSTSLEKVRIENPLLIMQKAVKGMLPQNKLRDRMLTRLYLFKESEHSFGAKFS
ncbi:50S ribosomal protein L13 [Candidatus Gottesmanbacteria bacterium]|nr:50S ribosomal protein L13 [Candidatus Gottesmanbacteria bacterium]